MTVVRSLLFVAVLAGSIVLPYQAQAANIRVGSGALIYTDGAGTAADEPESSDITIEPDVDPTKYLVTDALTDSARGLELGAGCSRPDPLTHPGLFDDAAVCGPVANITTIRFTLGAGDDRATIEGLNVRGELNGGDGDDDLTGGVQADTLIGAGGYDTMLGGPGNDGSAASGTTVSGGSDDDSIDGEDGNDVVRGGDESEVDGGGDWITGGEGDDQLYGDGGADIVEGGNGNDVVEGASGEDQLYGDGNDDRLVGGSDDDQLQPGYGNDTVDGQGGADVVSYDERPATESLHLKLAEGRGPGNGTSENDTFTSVEGAAGGRGNDVIEGSSGDNVVAGGGGSDVVMGAGGNDYVGGGSGDNDVLIGGPGADQLVGGPGVGDVADYSDSAGAVYVDPAIDGGDGQGCSATSSGSCENDDVLDTGAQAVETIKGSSHADTLYATVANMRLIGGPGNDKLYAKLIIPAQRPDVYLDGGPGADLLQGSQTIATVAHADYTNRSRGVYVDLNDASGEGEGCPGVSCEGDQLVGINVIDGSQFDDTLIRDSLYAGYLNGYGGNDDLRGGTNQEFIDGGPGDDTLTGGPASDALWGKGGNDTLFAKDGAGDAVWCMDGTDDSYVADAVIDDVQGCEHDLGSEPPPVPDRATVSVSGSGSVSYAVTAQDDNDLTVTRSGSALVIADANAAATIADGDGSGGCSVLGSVAVCPGGNALSANLGDGNDRLRVAATGVPTVADGGSGNDTLIAGDAADQLFGSAGDDLLDGGLGADALNGGGGGEVFGDTVDYGIRATAIKADIDGKTGDDGASKEKDSIAADIENLIGGSGNDTLKGSSADNRLEGAGGRDKLDGLAGNDRVLGGSGDKDSIKGGAGNDELDGGPGLDDNLNAGDGDDVLKAVDGQRDKLSCGAGSDEYAIDLELDKFAIKSCETRLEP